MINGFGNPYIGLQVGIQTLIKTQHGHCTMIISTTAFHKSSHALLGYINNLITDTAALTIHLIIEQRVGCKSTRFTELRYHVKIHLFSL